MKTPTPNQLSEAGLPAENCSAVIVVEIEGTTKRELWSNLNWMLCNAIEVKKETGDWPDSVMESNRGRISIRQNDKLTHGGPTNEH